jgi:uncharacterized repeat protein (TIGR02543 family)
MKKTTLFQSIILSVLLFALSFNFVFALSISISTESASKWKPELLQRPTCRNGELSEILCERIYESCFRNGNRIRFCHIKLSARFLTSLNYNVYFTERQSGEIAPANIPVGTILKLNIGNPEGEWFFAGGSFDSPPISFVDNAERDYQNMASISPLYQYSVTFQGNLLSPKVGIAATNPIKNLGITTNDKFQILRQGNDYYLKAINPGRGEIRVTFPQVFAYVTIDNLWFQSGQLPSRTYTFYFNILEEPKYTLSVSKIGAGKITGPGIDCGTDCTEIYDRNTLVSLQAIPQSGWSFVGWSGDCSGTGPCNLTMDNNKNVTATFQLQNQPPTAAFSCDPSACQTTDCKAYQGCLFRFLNNSQDPENKILRSEWDIIGQGQSPDIVCEGANALCHFTPQTSLLPPGQYQVKLKVIDDVGNSNSTTSNFYILREARADFMCSLDNTTWQPCQSIKPYKGDVVYFKDDPSLERHSIPSEEASSILQRIWKLNGNVFSSGNDTNPSTTILSEGQNTVELMILDDKGRSASASYQFSAQKPPIWFPR